MDETTDRVFAEATQFGVLAEHYDDLMDVVPYDFWADYVQTLFDVADHQPTRILDCACGTGNLSFELAGRGLDVTGVDISEAMIAVANAKANGVFFDLKTQFEVADLTNFELGRRFDCATCLYDSLNYILDPTALGAAFGCIDKHLEEGGVFVFDLNSPRAFERNLFSQTNHNPRTKIHYDWQADFNQATRICDVKMRFERMDADGNRQEFFERHRERAYDLGEVESLLEAAGLRLENSYDAYTLNRPHGRSDRWFFVARKPAKRPAGRF